MIFFSEKLKYKQVCRLITYSINKQLTMGKNSH